MKSVKEYILSMKTEDIAMVIVAIGVKVILMLMGLDLILQTISKWGCHA